MTTYLVSEVAAMAGVSIRTLHHYHEIGLLRPAYIGENNYRYYGKEELLRLQQILIHRQLGIPLADIGAILDAPGFNRLAALEAQRARIAQDLERMRELLKTVDRTIANLKGDRNMKIAELYSGVVSSEKQAEYETWLEELYGPEVWQGDRLGPSMKDHGTGTKKALMSDLASIEEKLAQSFRDGVVPEARLLDPLIERHRAWVASSWGRPCTPESYAALASVYEHPDFVDRFDAIEEGFSKYLCAAMRSWARRQG